MNSSDKSKSSGQALPSTPLPTYSLQSITPPASFHHNQLTTRSLLIHCETPVRKRSFEFISPTNTTISHSDTPSAYTPTAKKRKPTTVECSKAVQPLRRSIQENPSTLETFEFDECDPFCASSCNTPSTSSTQKLCIPYKLSSRDALNRITPDTVLPSHPQFISDNPILAGGASVTSSFAPSTDSARL